MTLAPKTWSSASVGFELGAFHSGDDELSTATLSSCKFPVYMKNAAKRF